MLCLVLHTWNTALWPDKVTACRSATTEQLPAFQQVNLLIPQRQNRLPWPRNFKRQKTSRELRNCLPIIPPLQCQQVPLFRSTWPLVLPLSRNSNRNLQTNSPARFKRRRSFSVKVLTLGCLLTVTMITLCSGTKK